MFGREQRSDGGEGGIYGEKSRGWRSQGLEGLRKWAELSKRLERMEKK